MKTSTQCAGTGVSNVTYTCESCPNRTLIDEYGMCSSRSRYCSKDGKCDTRGAEQIDDCACPRHMFMDVKAGTCIHCPGYSSGALRELGNDLRRSLSQWLVSTTITDHTLSLLGCRCNVAIRRDRNGTYRERRCGDSACDGQKHCEYFNTNGTNVFGELRRGVTKCYLKCRDGGLRNASARTHDHNTNWTQDDCALRGEKCDGCPHEAYEGHHIYRCVDGRAERVDTTCNCTRPDKCTAALLELQRQKAALQKELESVRNWTRNNETSPNPSPNPSPNHRLCNHGTAMQQNFCEMTIEMSTPLGLAVTSSVIIFVVTFVYCAIMLPSITRVGPARRVAFILANSEYTHLHRLPGVAVDAKNMCDALEECGFEVLVCMNVMEKQTDDGKGFMGIFILWMGRLGQNEDVVVYLACHGLQVEGSTWLVMGGANIDKQQGRATVTTQCVQINAIRRMVSEKYPRITIYMQDCCAETFKVSNEVNELDEQHRSRDARMSLHNASRKALNVIIFKGAADSTSAKEDQFGGAFTNALIMHMATSDLSLNELSNRVRKTLTAGSKRNGPPLVNDKVEVVGNITSINETSQELTVGIHGVVKTIDEDGDYEIDIKNGFGETQWVACNDVVHLSITDDVQVSPTESYLTTMSSWSFRPSPTMCCGIIP